MPEGVGLRVGAAENEGRSVGLPPIDQCRHARQFWTRFVLGHATRNSREHSGDERMKRGESPHVQSRISAQRF